MSAWDRIKNSAGNIEHTMLVEGRSYFVGYYSYNAKRRFYQFGEFEYVSSGGSRTYPCGSVSGTPDYMCVSELRQENEICSIAADKDAEFVVLNEKLFETNPYALHKTKPEAVVMEGELISGAALTPLHLIE